MNRAEPIMPKNLFMYYSFPNFPKFWSIILILFPYHLPIILNCSCDFHCINDNNNVHKYMYTCWLLYWKTGCFKCRLFFRIYVHEIFQVHLHHHHHFRDYFITFIHCNFQLCLYHAHESPLIPELFSLKLQPIIFKIMLA